MTGSDEVELSVNEASNTIGIPIRIRERYLTQRVEEAEVQLIGRHLRITFWSERYNISLFAPLKEWQTGDSSTRRLHGANSGLISVGAFIEDIAVERGSVPCEIRTHQHDRP